MQEVVTRGWRRVPAATSSARGNTAAGNEVSPASAPERDYTLRETLPVVAVFLGGVPLLTWMAEFVTTLFLRRHGS